MGGISHPESQTMYDLKSETETEIKDKEAQRHFQYRQRSKINVLFQNVLAK